MIKRKHIAIPVNMLNDGTYTLRHRIEGKYSYNVEIKLCESGFDASAKSYFDNWFL